MGTARRTLFWSLLLLVSSGFLISCGGAKKEKPKSKTLGGKAIKKTIEKVTIGIPKVEEQIIREDTVWTKEKSPILLNMNVVVRSDVKLTIEAGVEIKADPRVMILVSGNLNADGTADEPIRFSPSQEDGKWDGIQFLKGSFDYDSEEVIRGHGCSLDYVVVEGTDTGVTCVKSSPHITNSLFRNNNTGVSARDDSNPLIQNNKFLDNVTAIYCYNSSSPLISQNTIIGEEGRGVRVETYSNPEIVGNLIFGRGQTWWVGVYVKHSSAPKINNNAIYSNGRYELELDQKTPSQASPDIDATNNWWGIPDKVTIGKRIKDKNDFPNLGLVKFEPFKTEKLTKVGYVGKLK